MTTTPALPWHTARRVAASAQAALPPTAAHIAESIDCILHEPLVALSDLPAFAAAAMDGFAVSENGPWLITGERVLAGRSELSPLAAGQAAAIATGALLPIGTTAVLRFEDGVVEGALHGQRLFRRDPLTGLADDASPALPAAQPRR